MPTRVPTYDSFYPHSARAVGVRRGAWPPWDRRHLLRRRRDHCRCTANAVEMLGAIKQGVGAIDDDLLDDWPVPETCNLTPAKSAALRALLTAAVPAVDEPAACPMLRAAQARAAAVADTAGLLSAAVASMRSPDVMLDWRRRASAEEIWGAAGCIGDAPPAVRAASCARTGCMGVLEVAGEGGMIRLCAGPRLLPGGVR